MSFIPPRCVDCEVLETQKSISISFIFCHLSIGVGGGEEVLVRSNWNRNEILSWRLFNQKDEETFLVVDNASMLSGSQIWSDFAETTPKVIYFCFPFHRAEIGFGLFG